jgi:hypothetical protein
MAFGDPLRAYLLPMWSIAGLPARRVHVQRRITNGSRRRRGDGGMVRVEVVNNLLVKTLDYNAEIRV